MARPSKIDRLPPELRVSIARLREQGRTIDEILAHLQQLGADVSRSGLGRHVQGLDQLGEQIRSSRAVAEALVQRFGDAPENRQARLNIELMHSLIMRLFAAMSAGEGDDGAPATLDPKEVMFLASALKSLTGAARDDAELVSKLRKQVAEQAADQAVKTAKAQGLTADTIAAIRQSVLGVAA